MSIEKNLLPKFGTNLYNSCKWCEKQFSLDYPPLDTEHKDFLNTLRSFVSDLLKKKSDRIPKMFDLCYEYVRTHFSDEEDLMERIKFPDIMAHMNSHQAFIKNIAEFRQLYENAETQGKKLEAAEQTLSFVVTWAVGHILNRDKVIKPYLVRLRNLPPRMNY